MRQARIGQGNHVAGQERITRTDIHVQERTDVVGVSNTKAQKVGFQVSQSNPTISKFTHTLRRLDTWPPYVHLPNIYIYKQRISMCLTNCPTVSKIHVSNCLTVSTQRWMSQKIRS